MSVQTTPTEWMSAKEAAKVLGGVSDNLIYKLFHAGELKGVKVAGAIRIRAASVQAYLAAHSNNKATEVTAASEPASIAPRPRQHRRRGLAEGYRFVPRS